MKRKTFAVVAAGIALTFALAGCTTPAQENPAGEDGLPTATATPAPTLGDATILLDPANEPVVVEGQWGSYKKLTVNPTSAAVTTPVGGDELYIAKWTSEDTLSAQQYVARYIVEQFYDSIALGTNETLPEWKSTVAPSWVDTDFVTVDKSGNNGFPTSLVLTQNDRGTFPAPIEDGKPRYSDVTLRFQGVETLNENGVEYLTLKGTTTGTMRSTTESLTEILKINGRTDEEIAKYELIPGEEGSLIISGSFRYTLGKTDNSWTIAGYQNNYDFQIK